MLRKSYAVIAAAIAITVGCFSLAHAQEGKRAGSLTADDYIEIQQLYVRYNISLDAGDAETYAQTFVPDGVFNKNVGHDALSAFANNWHDNMKGANMRHWNTNLAIMPAAGGAKGSVYLLLVDVSVKPPAISAAAKYDDQLVKTPQGWRFSKRATLGEGAPPLSAEKK